MTKIIRLKAMAVGYGRAGKTSMLITHDKKKFPEDYAPAIYEIHVDELSEGLRLAYCDNPGAEDYAGLRPLGYPGTDVFILCFDVTKKDLFAELESYWYAELRHHCPYVPIILTATKIDLRETEENCVTTEEGEALAAKTRSHYAEISSLKGVGLDELFTKVVELGREHYAAAKDKRKKKCIVL